MSTVLLCCQTRNQMIASLESALSETASSDQKKLIEARIAELKREVEVIRKTWQLMDPHKMHQLKSQVLNMNKYIKGSG